MKNKTKQKTKELMFDFANLLYANFLLFFKKFAPVFSSFFCLFLV